MEKQHNYGVDLIKTGAIFFVLMIHCGNYTAAVGSVAWTATLLWTGLARPAVPLFLMCTGALLLPPEREVSLKTLWLRYLPRLALSMLVWALGYKVFHLLTTGSLSGTALLSIRKGSLDETFFQGMSVGVCLAAAGLFSLCIPSCKRLPLLTESVSRASFCVYLVHMLVLYAFRRFGFVVTALPTAIAVPLYALCALLPSLAIWWLLSKIPVVNKYLI